MNKYPTLYAVLAAQAAPDQWWSKMFQEIKKKKPTLPDQKVREAIGDIWYQKLDEQKRVEIRRKFHASVTSKLTLADISPELAAIIDSLPDISDDRVKEATAGAWKFCKKCVRMTPHDEKGNCKEH